MQDLDAIMDSRPQGNEAENEQQREDGRDERGRFASQARVQAEEQAQQVHVDPAQQEQQSDPNKPPPGFIPQQAFDARMAKAEEKWSGEVSGLRSQLDQALGQLRQFQQRPAQPVEQPKRPEFFDDPDAAFEARLKEAISPIAQSQTSIVENFSKMMASDKFGEEIVGKAEADLRSRVNANPQGMHATYLRIMNSPHPYGELVRWHKEQTALTTYGDDPEAWRAAERERMKAELLAEMQGGQQQQPAQQQQPQAMPTSFAGARNNGPRAAVAFSGPKPLSEIMGGR